MKSLMIGECNVFVVKKRYGPMAPMVGTLLCRFGDEMSATALLLFAYSASGGVSTAALVFASLTVSAAIGGPVLGAILDRSQRPGAQLAAAVAAYALGIGICAGLLRYDYISAALVVGFLAGLAGPSIAGGWSAQLRGDSVTGPRLAVFDASSYSAAALAGPLCSGVLYAWLGPAAPLMATIGLLLLGGAFALALPRTDQRTVRPVLHSMVEGWRTLMHNAGLRRATLSSCIAFVGMGLFTSVVPLLGEVAFGDAGRGALLLALLAATALFSNAVVSRCGMLDRPYRLLAISTAVASIGLVLIATARPWAVIGGVMLMGSGDGPQLASLIRIRHLEAPMHLLAQVFTTGASLKIASAGVGALVAAVMGEHGLSWMVGVAALAHLVAAAVARQGATTLDSRAY